MTGPWRVKRSSDRHRARPRTAIDSVTTGIFSQPPR
jgi:hypothetical protein